MQIASKLLFTALSAPAFTQYREVKITFSCRNFHLIKITPFFPKPTKSFFMFSSLRWEEGQTSQLLQSGLGIQKGSTVSARILASLVIALIT